MDTTRGLCPLKTGSSNRRVCVF